MSTYSNNPQQNKWTAWFLTSVTILIVLLIVVTTLKPIQIPTWYNILMLIASINLVSCIIIGFKK